MALRQRVPGLLLEVGVTVRSPLGCWQQERTCSVRVRTPASSQLLGPGRWAGAPSLLCLPPPHAGPHPSSFGLQFVHP